MNIFDFIVLFGITQGLITSLLLLCSKGKNLSNKLLAFGIISFCLLSVKILLHTLDLWSIPYIRYFPLGIDLAIPPLIYFYAISLIQPNLSLRSKYFITFIPFILFMSYSIIVYAFVLPIEQNAIKDKIAVNLLFTPIKKIEDYLTLASIFIYIFFGLRKLRFHKKEMLTDVNYNWLKQIIGLMFSLGLFSFLNMLYGLFYPDNSILRWQAFYIYVAVIVYYIGFKGYKHSLFKQKVKAGQKHIKINDDEVNSIIREIEKAVLDDKFYLNPKASIGLLAEKLSLNSRELTSLFQNNFNSTFKGYINQKRVDEVKSKFADSSTDNLTILGIALESGFNSEASFYRIFKKHTGLSPKEYRIRSKNISK